MLNMSDDDGLHPPPRHINTSRGGTNVFYNKTQLYNKNLEEHGVPLKFAGDCSNLCCVDGMCLLSIRGCVVGFESA